MFNNELKETSSNFLIINGLKTPATEEGELTGNNVLPDGYLALQIQVKAYSNQWRNAPGIVCQSTESNVVYITKNPTGYQDKDCRIIAMKVK